MSDLFLILLFSFKVMLAVTCAHIKTFNHWFAPCFPKSGCSLKQFTKVINLKECQLRKDDDWLMLGSMLLSLKRQ